MRITGGVHRSRILRTPKGTNTRPTADRVREAMFSILAARRELTESNVLDLYAGTGALGLEALSRGARRATFVECSQTALAALRANLTALELDSEVRVVSGLVEKSIPAVAAEAPFDFILADPPYALVRNGEATETLTEAIRAGLLAAGGIVVLEHGAQERAPTVTGLCPAEVRRYGDTLLSFYSS
jgi:16S rRNA (guanine966-N2)-methyltransferase